MTRVLLVDDDPWVADLESHVLERAGYEVMAVGHALAAVQAVDSFRPEVIMLDVLLAGSTAFALLHELQTYTDTGKVPVILCTNIAEQFEQDELASYGVRRVVDKSTMVPADLVAAVRAVTL